MLFNSPTFLLIFLPLALVGFFAAAAYSHRLAALTLALASVCFYAMWDPRFVALLVLSIAFNYRMGFTLGKVARTRLVRPLLAGAIAANLGLLAYFKYTDFFISTANQLTGAHLPLAHIILPLGISFFTFTQVAFLVDVARGLAVEYDFVHYLLFVTYFPHLVAGPILHHRQMMPQFSSSQTYKFNPASFSDGMATFLVGLAKKVVIADALSAFVGPLFDAVDNGTSVTFFEAWGAALAYTFQLYFDFSGYSDMAIGLSLLFGVRLPPNFASPYKSRNIVDFWRRWHMTLSQFLRDYLYIPLGGGRRGPMRRHLNLMATMLLGGLWHGASWTFVVWGATHGCYLVVNHVWQSLSAALPRPGIVLRPLNHALSCVVTFIAVVAAWVVFRATSLHGANEILAAMTGAHGFVLPAQIADMAPALRNCVSVVGKMPLLGNGSVMGVFEQMSLICVAAAVCFACPNTQEMSPRMKAAAVLVSIGFVVQGIFFGRAPSPFLYFQF